MTRDEFHSMSDDAQWTFYLEGTEEERALISGEWSIQTPEEKANYEARKKEFLEIVAHREINPNCIMDDTFDVPEGEILMYRSANGATYINYNVHLKLLELAKEQYEKRDVLSDIRKTIEP